VTKGDSKSWTISATGLYNYDDAWTFKKLEVYLTYTKGMETKAGPSWSCTNETTLAVPGTFSVTFNNVAPPGEGEVLTIVAKITVSQTGQPDQNNSEGKDVPAPPPEEDPEHQPDYPIAYDQPRRSEHAAVVRPSP
jgi:hypothetical protein